MSETKLQLELNEYVNILLNEQSGQVGRNYLKSRGIHYKTVLHWTLGYCPIGYIPSIYKGKENNDYKPWEKMWGRIIIPIFDQNGTVVSLSGRLVVKVDFVPKYDHYSFPSRKILFGLYQNKEDIRLCNRLIITEGQIDVISAWQQGLRNVSSSFGAHCSLDHFAIASRYASIIDVLYDADDAGKKGTDAIEGFPTYGDLVVNLHNNIFPVGEDLDSWIKKHSIDELNNLLNKQKMDEFENRLNFIKRC